MTCHCRTNVFISFGTYYVSLAKFSVECEISSLGVESVIWGRVESGLGRSGEWSGEGIEFGTCMFLKSVANNEMVN